MCGTRRGGRAVKGAGTVHVSHASCFFYYVAGNGYETHLPAIRSKTQDFVLKILGIGPLPNHVAFVMDGNRRYARIDHKEVQQGHNDGFITLRRVSC